MNEVGCAVEGCKEVFKTEGPVSSNVRFICKNHPRAVQCKTTGKTFDPELDMRDANDHFQDGQFDVQFGRRISPLRDDKNAPGGMTDLSKWRVDSEPGQ